MTNLTLITGATGYVGGRHPVDLEVGEALDFWRVELSSQVGSCDSPWR